MNGMWFCRASALVAVMARIEPGPAVAGKIADLVILDADPLANIRNTRRIAAVIMRGRVVERVPVPVMRGLPVPRGHSGVSVRAAAVGQELWLPQRR